MDDNTRAALDAEAPVNPYSLLDALNTAAARSTTLWLMFLGLTVYLALAVAALTHRDLLLDSGIVLPLLQVRIDFARFFIFAPAIFALLHLMMLAHFAVLARKTLEFDAALRLLESTDLRSHPLRLELDSFFFVQALAGPERSRVVSALLNAIGWLTLLVLPVLLLLWMQVAFLPFHHAGVTAVQRATVLADIVVLLLGGVFVMRAETSFFGAVLRLIFNNPGSVAFALIALAGAAFVSMAAAVPGAGGDGLLFSLLPRNLDVADTRLVAGRDGAGAAPLSLRGRDLRFARLDRVDLRQADLTGANLDGASLAGADLRGARLACAYTAVMQQPDGRLKAGCARAQGADFTGASMAGAGLVGTDLRGAKLDDASLEGADLGQAVATGATFERARLQRAVLAGASLDGASFVAANLQGTDLAGAGLQMADFSGTALQGARLASARLAGAVLREADLEGAELRDARLFGADMRGARLPAADLAGATVWRAVPPAPEATGLADLADIAIKPPGKDDVEQLKAVAAAIEARAAGERTAGLSGLIAELGPDAAWGASADAQTWANLLRTSEAGMAEGFRSRLGEHLARLACRARFADAAVAAGVARRAASGVFKGDPGLIADRLRAADCPASKALPASAARDLAAAAEAARGP
ncbi:MAG TPA: pentapeptide repeat-containing protein [Hyphomicrobiaceae bacterium]|jgi:uncharacterized protein YjbI with pentapeptide repeats